MSTGKELVTLGQANGFYKDLRERSAPVIYDTVSDNPIFFNDGSDNLPIKSFIVNFNPIQASGTPSPTNPLAIS